MTPEKFDAARRIWRHIDSLKTIMERMEGETRLAVILEHMTYLPTEVFKEGELKNIEVLRDELTALLNRRLEELKKQFSEL